MRTALHVLVLLAALLGLCSAQDCYQRRCARKIRSTKPVSYKIAVNAVNNQDNYYRQIADQNRRKRQATCGEVEIEIEVKIAEKNVEEVQAERRRGVPCPGLFQLDRNDQIQAKPSLKDPSESVCAMLSMCDCDYCNDWEIIRCLRQQDAQAERERPPTCPRPPPEQGASLQAITQCRGESCPGPLVPETPPKGETCGDMIEYAPVPAQSVLFYRDVPCGGGSRQQFFRPSPRQELELDAKATVDCKTENVTTDCFTLIKPQLDNPESCANFTVCTRQTADPCSEPDSKKVADAFRLAEDLPKALSENLIPAAIFATKKDFCPRANPCFEDTIGAIYADRRFAQKFNDNNPPHPDTDLIYHFVIEPRQYKDCPGTAGTAGTVLFQERQVRQERQERQERQKRQERQERQEQELRFLPIVIDPQCERPRFEEPRFEEPRFEEPQFEEPRFEEPQFEEPRFEEPRFEEPRFEEPRFEEERFGKMLKEDSHGGDETILSRKKRQVGFERVSITMSRPACRSSYKARCRTLIRN